jgi:hypothetical protein
MQILSSAKTRPCLQVYHIWMPYLLGWGGPYRQNGGITRWLELHKDDYIILPRNPYSEVVPDMEHTALIVLLGITFIVCLWKDRLDQSPFSPR